MTPQRIAVARGLIAGVIRRWPMGAPETRALREALELLAPETVEQAENMHHIGSTDTSSETAGLCNHAAQKSGTPQESAGAEDGGDHGKQ